MGRTVEYTLLMQVLTKIELQVYECVCVRKGKSPFKGLGQYLKARILFKGRFIYSLMWKCSPNFCNVFKVATRQMKKIIFSVRMPNMTYFTSRTNLNLNYGIYNLQKLCIEELIIKKRNGNELLNEQWNSCCECCLSNDLVYGRSLQDTSCTPARARLSAPSRAACRWSTSTTILLTSGLWSKASWERLKMSAWTCVPS